MRVVPLLSFFACTLLSLLAGCLDAPMDGEPIEATDLADDVLGARFVDHADAVPRSYIVVLRADGRARDHADLAATIDRLAGTHEVTWRYEHAVRGFTATMTEADARVLADAPEVAYVEEDAVVHGDEAVFSNATWGLDRIDQATLPLDTKYTTLSDGAGVTAFVLDSGIRASHSEFTGRLLPGFAGVNDGQGTNDCNQHGTHVSGTIGGTVLGVAKKVQIVPVRVLGCDNSGQLSTILAGIDFVLANKRPLSVVNMSLGTPASDTVDTAVRRMVTAGITVVVSSGNNNTDACTQSPARLPDVITVGATDRNDARATFSNYGACVDLHAPGVDINSASFNGDGLARMLSGTSMATPHVTGAAALFLATHPGATPAQVTQAMLAGASTGKVTDLRGSADRLLVTTFVDTVAPIVTFTSPTPNATVPSSVTIKGTATDLNLVRFTLSIDGVERITVGEDEIELVAELAPGAHRHEHVALDGGTGRTTQSLDITVEAPPAPLPPEEPGTDTPELTGGCAAGGTPGALAMLGLLGLARRRRRS